MDYDALSERKFLKYDIRLIARAREMRKNPTKSEKCLWENFLKYRPNGFKFSRQKPIGGYILDFYCSKALLCIEIDGDIHDKEYDAIRDEYLKSIGIKTLRFEVNKVILNIDGIIKSINQYLVLKSPPVKGDLGG